MKILGLFSKRPKSDLTCKGGLTQQHFKSECDLNTIIKKYPDGVPPQSRVPPTYGDFTAIGKGLQESMNAMQYVGDWFQALPSDVRARFDNDPLAAQRFVLESDPAESAKLGLISLKETPKADGGAVKGAEKGAVAEPPKPATTTSPEGATLEKA